MYHLFFLAYSICFSQNIWLENFNSLNFNSQVDNGATSWSVDGPNSNKNFKWHNTNAQGVWLSESIDISLFTNTNIFITATSGNGNNSNDFLLFEYSLNGVAYMEFETNGALSGIFNNQTALTNTFQANTVQIRVTGNSTGIGHQLTIDDVTVVGQSILPVELISFNLTQLVNSDIKINWLVGTEKDVNYYSIYISEDGEDFKLLEEIKSLGDMQSSRMYELIFNNKSKAGVYVKLLHTDLNGESKVLDIT